MPLSVQKKAIGGFAWLGSAKLVSQLASWISTVAVARMLLPSDYGMMAIAIIFVELGQIIGEAGVTQGLIQKQTTSRAEEDGIFYLNVLVSVLLFAVLCAVAPWLSDVYELPMLRDVLCVAGLGFVLMAIKAVPYAITMRQQNYRFAAIVESLATLAGTAAVLVLALLDFGVWSLVFSYLLKNVLITLAYLTQFQRIPVPIFRWADIQNLLGFGAKLLSSETFRFLYMRADMFLVGKYLGSQAAGYFGMAYQLATIPLDKIGTVFNRVAMPAIAALQRDPSLGSQFFIQVHRYLFLIAAPILIGMALVADPLVRVLLTDRWIAVVPVVQLLCAVNLLRLSAMLMSPALAALGRADQVLRFNGLCFLLLPPSFYFAVEHGIQGVAMAWLMTYPLPYIYISTCLCRQLGLTHRELLSSVHRPLLACCGMAAALQLFPWTQLSVPLLLAFKVLLGACVFFLILISSPSERARLKRGFETLSRDRGVYA